MAVTLCVIPGIIVLLGLSAVYVLYGGIATVTATFASPAVINGYEKALGFRLTGQGLLQPLPGGDMLTSYQIAACRSE